MKLPCTINIVFCLLIMGLSFSQNNCNCDYDGLEKKMILLNQRDSSEVFVLANYLKKSKLKACQLKSLELQFKFYLTVKELDMAMHLLSLMEKNALDITCLDYYNYQIYLNRAKYYRVSNNFEKLSEFAFEALKVSEELKDPEKEIEAIKEIVHLFTRMDEDGKNWNYIKRVEKLIFNQQDIIKSIKNYRWLAFEYEKKYTTTNRKTLLDSLLIFINQSKKGALKYGMYDELALSYRALEAYWYHNGEIGKALQHIDSAIYYGRKIKGIKNLSGLYISKAWDYLDLGEKEQAVEWMDSALAVNNSNDLAGKMHEYFDASNLYNLAGKPDKAYNSFKVYSIMKDSILNTERVEIINELETKYKTELKDAQIKRLIVLLIVASLFIIIILFIGKIIQLKRTRQKNEALKIAFNKQVALEKELTDVRENIAQDFHDDLGNRLARISLLSNLVNNEVSGKDEKLKSKVKQITDDANDLYLGTRDFIFSLKTNSDYIEELVTYLSDFGENYFSKTHIKFKLEKHVEINDKLPYYWSKQLIYIFKEAITNTLKHAQCSEVELRFNYKNNQLLIECLDNGVGIEEDDLNSSNGLSNMKERAIKIGGNLYIELNNKNGTIIRFIGKTVVQHDTKSSHN